jgi:hypothetical protein
MKDSWHMLAAHHLGVNNTGGAVVKSMTTTHVQYGCSLSVTKHALNML